MSNENFINIQHRIDGYLKNLIVYQFNVCPMPKAMGQRLLLNEEMWLTADEEEVNKIPDIHTKLRARWLTIPNQGNRIVDGDRLDILDTNVLDEMLQYDLFPMFNACFEEDMDRYQRNDMEYLGISTDDLCILGWEVSNSFGFGSASYEGIYPLYDYTDYYYVKEISEHKPINKWGLFATLELTKKYIGLNNEHNANTAPWFANPILTTKTALARLEQIYEQRCGDIA